jgi:hypothetical protein
VLSGISQAMQRMRIACVAAVLSGCTPTESRFALRAPVWTDPDLQSVPVACHPQPTARDPLHVSCAPVPTEVPEMWMALDHVVLRPLSEALAITV